MFLIFLNGTAFAANGVARWGTAPEFVVDAAIPKPNPARLRQVGNGVYELLYDTQVRVEGNLETTYRRRAYQVVDRSGLEGAAQIEIDFDPSFEGLVLHHVRIFRKGREVNVRNDVSLDVLRKEKELDDGVLTGVRTALLRLPDVRVGDIIDAGWSWVSRPPLWPGQYFGSMQLNWSAPVAFTRYRIDLPATNDFAVHRYRDAPAARQTVRDGRKLVEWTSIDPDPVVEDDRAPQWHRPWQRVALSTMPRWSEVVQWALPLYASANSLPPELSDDLARIARVSDPRVRAVKALRLVQDRIRYTSLSIGPGSYRPRSPVQVVRQGWGDCKDKAQLLVSMLRRLGIEAYPALTDSDEGASLPTRIPSPAAFDHVIVEIRIGGKSYWVDPTISHQGGDLANLAPLPYRYALPIRPGQGALQPVQLSPLVKPNVEAVETYRFGPKGIRLDAVTTYGGAAADEARAGFATTALSEKEAGYFRFYAGSYSGLELRAPLAVDDDRESNTFVVREFYWLPRDAYADGKLLEAFPVHAVTLGDTFTYPEGGRRVHPLALSFPVNKTHKIVLIASELSIAAPDEIKFDNDTFRFALTADRSGDTLTILFSLIGKKSIIEASEFGTFISDADKLAENLEWTLPLSPGPYVEGRTAGLMVVSVGALILLFIAGIVHARRQRNAFKDGESFYPVPLRKFVPLSVASWGLYTAYWFWRNWNWVKQCLGEEILPFWRALFGAFWLHPLFDRANGRSERPLPLWLGIGGSVMFLLWTVGTSVAERIDESSMIPTLLGTLSSLFVIPAVVAVNRNNSAEAVLSNGRFGWLGFAALLLGPCTMILLFLV